MEELLVCCVCHAILTPGTHDWHLDEHGERVPICYAGCVGYGHGKSNKPCPCHSYHIVDREPREIIAPCERRFHEALEKYWENQKEGEELLIEVIGDIYFHGCTPHLNPPNEEEWLEYVRSGLSYHGFSSFTIEKLICLATSCGGWQR